MLALSLKSILQKKKKKYICVSVTIIYIKMNLISIMIHKIFFIINN